MRWDNQVNTPCSKEDAELMCIWFLLTEEHTTLSVRLDVRSCLSGSAQVLGRLPNLAVMWQFQSFERRIKLFL